MVLIKYLRVGVACSVPGNDRLRLGYAQSPFTPNSTESGLRVPEGEPLLVVGSSVQVIMVPNPNKGYVLQFFSFLAKHDLEAQFQNGMLVSLTSNQDSTAVPVAFLAALGQAAQAAKTSLLGAFAGSAPGGSNKFQVYRFIFDGAGNLTGLDPLIKYETLLDVPTAISIPVPSTPTDTASHVVPNPAPAPVTPVPSQPASPGQSHTQPQTPPDAQKHQKS